MPKTIELMKVSKEESHRIWQLNSCFTDLHKDKPRPEWSGVDYDFATDVMITLCVCGFGRKECPSVSQWASFAIVTGVAAAITGNEYIIGESMRFQEKAETDYALFSLLDKTAGRKAAASLDRNLLSALLSLAFPAFHDMSGDPLSSNYSRSSFCCRWDSLAINPSCMRSIGYVDEGWRKHFQKEVKPKLSQGILQSIRLCQPTIRFQTQYTCGWVRAHYHW